MANPKAIAWQLSDHLNTWPFPVVFLVCCVLFDGLWWKLPLVFLASVLSARAYRILTCKEHTIDASQAVLVTGCSTGIGKDAAIRLLQRGFTVFATVRKASDGDALKKAVGTAAKHLEVLIMDVQDNTQVMAARDAVARWIDAGSLSCLQQPETRSFVGLVNNAGLSNSLALELLPAESLEKQLAVNVVGLSRVTSAFLPLLRRAAKQNPFRSSRIVQVSSGVGRLSFPGMGAYCASKHAVEALSVALRMELRGWNIDVGVVEPGAIATEFGATMRSTLQANFDIAKRSGQHADDVLNAYEQCMKAALKRSAEEQTRGSVGLVSDAIEEMLVSTSPLPRMLAGKDAQFVPIAAQLPDSVWAMVAGKGWPARNSLI